MEKVANRRRHGMTSAIAGGAQPLMSRHSQMQFLSPVRVQDQRDQEPNSKR